MQTSFNFYRPEQQQGHCLSMPAATWLGNGNREVKSISLSDSKGCQGGSA
jgi:hypothetical protein